MFKSSSTNKYYTANNGHRCKVIEKLKKLEVDIEETGEMFRVEFEGGLIIDVFQDELV